MDVGRGDVAAEAVAVGDHGMSALAADYQKYDGAFCIEIGKDRLGKRGASFDGKLVRDAHHRIGIPEAFDERVGDLVRFRRRNAAAAEFGEIVMHPHRDAAVIREFAYGATVFICEEAAVRRILGIRHFGHILPIVHAVFARKIEIV